MEYCPTAKGMGKNGTTKKGGAMCDFLTKAIEGGGASGPLRRELKRLQAENEMLSAKLAESRAELETTKEERNVWCDRCSNIEHEFLNLKAELTLMVKERLEDFEVILKDQRRSDGSM